MYEFSFIILIIGNIYIPLKISPFPVSSILYAFHRYAAFHLCLQLL